MSPAKLQRFVVRFQDWTAYRLEIEAESADHAIERAQQLSTTELWKAEAIDGSQEGWEAFQLPDDAPRGAP